MAIHTGTPPQVTPPQVTVPQVAVKDTVRLPPPPPWVEAKAEKAPKRKWVPTVPKIGPLPRGLKWTLWTVLPLLVVLVAAVLIFDWVQANNVLPGVTIEGSDVGGMSRADAAAVADTATARMLQQKVTIVGDDQVFPVTLADLQANADTQGAVDAALGGEGGSGLWAAVSGPFERTYHRLAGSPLDVDVSIRFQASDADVAAFVERARTAIDRPMVNSAVDVSGGALQITKSQSGRVLDAAGATQQIESQVDQWAHGRLPDGAGFALPIAITPAEVTEANIGQTAFVNKSAKRVWLYSGADLVATYPVAIGTPGHPTPSGDFKVVNKRKNPTWVNPAPNGWGAGMPASIGPGANNPLGTRAIDISASGIRFHGTNARSSVGTAASHGCMRMLREDVEVFFDQVEVGARVIIVDS